MRRKYMKKRMIMIGLVIGLLCLTLTGCQFEDAAFQVVDGAVEFVSGLIHKEDKADEEEFDEEKDIEIEEEEEDDDEEEGILIEEEEVESDLSSSYVEEVPQMRTSSTNPEVQALFTKLVQCEKEDENLKERADSASSQNELTGIAQARYKLWDDFINEIWAVLKKVKPEGEMNSILVDQRAWIKRKTAESDNAAAEYEGGSMQPMVKADCEAGLTRDRVYYLLGLLQ